MLAIFRVWYADENAIMRQKLQAATIRRMAPSHQPHRPAGHRRGQLFHPLPRTERRGGPLPPGQLRRHHGFADDGPGPGGTIRPSRDDGIPFAERFHQFKVTLHDLHQRHGAHPRRPAGLDRSWSSPGMLEDWFEEPPPPTPPIPAVTGAAGG